MGEARRAADLVSRRGQAAGAWRSWSPRRGEPEDEFEAIGRPAMLAGFIGEAYRRALTPEFWKIEGTLSPRRRAHDRRRDRRQRGVPPDHSRKGRRALHHRALVRGGRSQPHRDRFCHRPLRLLGAVGGIPDRHEHRQPGGRGHLRELPPTRGRLAAKPRIVGPDGESAWRLPLRAPVARAAADLRRRRHPHARPRHRHQHRHLQRDQGGAAEPAAVSGPLAAGGALGAEPGRQHRSGRAADLHRLESAVARRAVDGRVPPAALRVCRQRGAAQRPERPRDAEPVFASSASTRCSAARLSPRKASRARTRSPS